MGTFYRSHGVPLRDLEARGAYDARTADLVSALRPDLVLLSSYLYILTRPFLSAFEHRILNVHHGDLTVPDRDGRPRYRGLHAVRDAVCAGAAETRATVHLVTERLDEGPPILRSWPFPVSPLVGDAIRWGRRDVLRAYAFAHQEWMLGAAWGPLLASGIELVATGQIRVGDQGVWIGNGTEPWQLDRSGALIEPLAGPARQPARVAAWTASDVPAVPAGAP
jgi:hypothetical protein